MKPLVLSCYTATTCVGHGLAPLAAALRAGRGGLAPCAFENADLDICVGEVAGINDERLKVAYLGM